MKVNGTLNTMPLKEKIVPSMSVPISRIIGVRMSFTCQFEDDQRSDVMLSIMYNKLQFIDSQGYE